MFEKTKEFYNEHKGTIKTIGLVVGASAICVGTAVVGIKLAAIDSPKNRIVNVPLPQDLIGMINPDKALLESYGAVFKDGYSVPFATKDIALKFLEERGDTYQIDILDDLTSVIWIAGGEQ